MPEEIVLVRGVHKYFRRGSEQIDVLKRPEPRRHPGEFLA